MVMYGCMNVMNDPHKSMYDMHEYDKLAKILVGKTWSWSCIDDDFAVMLPGMVAMIHSMIMV